MTVKDLLDLDYYLPFVIDGVEYKHNSDIPKDLLLAPVEGFDLKEDPKERGSFKVYLILAHRKN